MKTCSGGWLTIFNWGASGRLLAIDLRMRWNSLGVVCSNRRRCQARIQVGEMLGVSTMSVIRLEKAGQLTGIKLTDRPGAMTRYRPSEIEALVEKRSIRQAKTLSGDALAVGAAQQGYSVALSADGNTAIVGGLGDNSNAGATWVYTRSGDAWTQQGSKLVGTGAVGAAAQGSSVALSAAWVYTRSGTVWTQ